MWQKKACCQSRPTAGQWERFDSPTFASAALNCSAAIGHGFAYDVELGEQGTAPKNIDDINEVININKAGDRLASTEVGKPIAGTLEDKGTKIHFGETEDAIAQFDPEENEITISNECHEASPNVLAAHLAHEGPHVQWDQPNSIEQEYHAFKAQAEVWKELKEDEADKQCDTVASNSRYGVRSDDFSRFCCVNSD